MLATPHFHLRVVGTEGAVVGPTAGPVVGPTAGPVVRPAGPVVTAAGVPVVAARQTGISTHDHYMFFFSCNN